MICRRAASPSATRRGSCALSTRSSRGHIPSCRARSREAEKNKNGPVQPRKIIVLQPSYVPSDLVFGHGRYFIDHQPARGVQPVLLGWIDESTKERGIGLVARKDTNGDRQGFVEAVILNDDGRSRACRRNRRRKRSRFRRASCL